jgi:hypothetical protein
MRRLSSIIASALLVGLAPTTHANDPVAPPSSAIVPALIEQLGAEGFADREAAAAKLEVIGLPAVDALRVATRNENPEIRDRAIVVLEKIQRVSDSSKRLTAKTVALSYKDVSLGSAFNDLKTRTGLNIVLDPNRVANPLRKITIETKELPVWEALEAFCQGAELQEVFASELETKKPQTLRRGYVPPPPTPNADTVPVLLIDGKAVRISGDRSSAVRILALPPSFTGHKVILGTGETNLCLDVTPAPGLGWQEVTAVKVSRVIDSAGRFGGAGTEKSPVNNFFDPTGVVMFARPGVVFRFDSSGNTILPESLQNPRVVPVPIRISTPSAKSLKRLEGLVFGEIQVQNQQLISVTDPKSKTNTAINGPGELRLTILEMKEAPGQGKMGTMKVQLEYPSPWLTNSRRRGGFNPGWPEAPQNPRQGYHVQAFDAEGKAFPNTTSSFFADTSDDGMVMIQTMQYQIRPETGLPAKLVVVGPRVISVQVPFALENVPLP